MKKSNKNRLLTILSLLILTGVLTFTAFTGILRKGDHAMINPPKKILNDGPIKLKSSLDNCYYYDNDHVYLYLDVKAEPGSAPYRRTPMNLAIVIDKSGSMSEKNKLDYVKRAVDYIIDKLGPDDYVSIVTYNDDVDVIQPSVNLSDKYDLREKVRDIKAGGYTNLSGGMLEGFSQVNRSYSRGYVNRVLLLTDGLANRGITDRYELADKVRDLNRRDGITISTFGVGLDYNENLLTDLADYGRGNYYYINNSVDIPEIFAQELNGVRSLVGAATKLRIKFPTEYLLLNKVYGYPYEISGNDVVIDFKDVFADQTKSVLIKFDIKRKIDTKIDFESDLTYDDVQQNLKSTEVSDNQDLQPVTSSDDYKKGNNETVQQNISMFESNDMMENALREADDGNYDRARTILKGAQTYMDGQMNSVAPSPEMKRQSENMDKYGKDLESIESKSADEKKEVQKSNKYDNYNTRKKQ